MSSEVMVRLYGQPPATLQRVQTDRREEQGASSVLAFQDACTTLQSACALRPVALGLVALSMPASPAALYVPSWVTASPWRGANTWTPGEDALVRCPAPSMATTVA